MSSESTVGPTSTPGGWIQARRLEGVHGDEFRLTVQRERIISLSARGSETGTLIGWRLT